MTTTDDALVRSVLAAPLDDAPRLVYADWLDEHGESERAEFIRVQCELARLDPSTYADVDRAIDLRRRERDLWELVGTVRLDVEAGLPRGFGASLSDPVSVVYGEGGGYGIVRRGFVDEVRVSMATLLGGTCGRCGGRGHHGMDPGRVAKPCQGCTGTGLTPGLAADLFRSQPITAVRLSDREPWGAAGEQFAWYSPSRIPADADFPLYPASDLPHDLWALIAGGDEEFELHAKWFPSHDDAVAALSTALVAHGRHAAGLPVLTPG